MCGVISVDGMSREFSDIGFLDNGDHFYNERVIRPMGCIRQRWNADYAFSQICRDGPHWLLFP